MLVLRLTFLSMSMSTSEPCQLQWPQAYPQAAPTATPAAKETAAVPAT
jgi:hypothetical protein